MLPIFLLIAAASAPPAMDLPRMCRGERSGVPADQQETVYQSCLHDEQAARDKLAQYWTQFPANVRTTCAELGRQVFSYVEVLTCIEIKTGTTSPTWSSQRPTLGAPQDTLPPQAPDAAKPQ